jgi:hypothetical protein
MRPISIDAVRSAALFVSTLQRSDQPGVAEVRQAIAQAIHDFGSKGCAERVAQEFGDHPEVAILRMRWARQVVEDAFHAKRPHAVQPHLSVFAHGRQAA